MGFKPWRILSVLLLASAALVGCNNTAQKDKSLGAGPKISDPSLAKSPANQLPGPSFPGSQTGAKSAFPTAPGNPNASPFDPQKSPFAPNNNSGNPNIQPLSGLGGAGTLNNSSPWSPTNAGNTGAPSIPNAPGPRPSNTDPYFPPQGSIPQPKSDVFGGDRQPSQPSNFPGNGPIMPQAPANFPAGR
jgi:predicted small secreted protein